MLLAPSLGTDSGVGPKVPRIRLVARRDAAMGSGKADVFVVGKNSAGAWAGIHAASVET